MNITAEDLVTHNTCLGCVEPRERRAMINLPPPSTPPVDAITTCTKKNPKRSRTQKKKILPRRKWRNSAEAGVLALLPPCLI
jgi:hypothetical protein